MKYASGCREAQQIRCHSLSADFPTSLDTTDLHISSKTPHVLLAQRYDIREERVEWPLTELLMCIGYHAHSNELTLGQKYTLTVR
jgi:hypothetical protein